jgi:carboxyl-terminal processing protease
MGNLVTSDVPWMYEDLKNTKAIIFDVRNYPKNTVWTIADLMFPRKLPTCRWIVPDAEYPGTCYRVDDSCGTDPVQSPYGGKVLILCDQQTQSHAELTCMILRAMPGAIVIGSQTAGADGNVTYLALSRDLTSGFTTFGVLYPDGTPTQRIGIVPDTTVQPTTEGVSHSRDEVLEKAMEMAGCPVVTSADDVPVHVPDQLPFLICYPNPFKTAVALSLSHPLNDKASFKVYDAFGRQVLDASEQLHGRSEFVLNRRLFPSAGVYFCRMELGSQSRVSMLCLAR